LQTLSGTTSEHATASLSRERAYEEEREEGSGEEEGAHEKEYGAQRLRAHEELLYAEEK
jgi:hypothetical protein